MQTKIIDPLSIRNFEKKHNLRLDEKELDDCLCAEGNLNAYRNGVWFNHKFDLILFPMDVSSENPDEHYESAIGYSSLVMTEKQYYAK